MSGTRVMDEASRLFDRAAFVTLVLLLWLAPIPLGSNRFYAWSALQLIAFGGLGAWLLGQLCGRPNPVTMRSAGLPAALLLAWVAYVALQSVSLAPTIVAAISPVTFQLQADLHSIGADARHTVSLDTWTTRQELLKYSAYVSVCLLALGTLTSRTRFKILAYSLVAIGTAEALFGLYANGTGLVVFPEQADVEKELRMGTFVNRNHFANLIALLSALCLGLCTATLRRPGGVATWRSVLPGNERNRVTMLLLAMALLIMVAAMVASNSRAATLAFVVCVLGMLVVARVQRGAGAKELWLGPVLLPVVFVVALWLGYDDSLLRIADANFFVDERIDQNRLGLALLPDFWVAGVGAGNYQWVLPAYRDETLRYLTYDHAHNDYLELVAEQGVIGMALLGAALIVIVHRLLSAYRRRRDRLMRGILFGSLCAIGIMMIHSLVEFNFRIPANAVFFFAIVGLGLAATVHGSRSVSRRGKPSMQSTATGQ